MNKFACLLFLLIIHSVSQAAQSNKYACGRDNEREIKAVIIDYVSKNTGISGTDIQILSNNCFSSYASAIIHPTKPVTDDATIYLHFTSNHWQVLQMGTGFDEAFLATIPKELRHLNQ